MDSSESPYLSIYKKNLILPNFSLSIPPFSTTHAYFYTVRKWFSILLLMILMLEAFTPCCDDADDCNQEVALGNDQGSSEHDETGICSPFFVCGTCNPAIVITLEASFDYLQIPHQSVYSSFVIIHLSGYYSSFFQPPRLS